MKFKTNARVVQCGVRDHEDKERQRHCRKLIRETVAAKTAAMTETQRKALIKS